MSCDDFDGDLISFHFGELHGEARERLEAHLPACRRCLGAYLGFKRDLESEQSLERPSAAARIKLRGAMAAQLAPPPWQWWQRPFAFGTAALVAAVALFLVFAVATGLVRGSAPIGRIAGSIEGSTQQAYSVARLGERGLL